jgi:hypothetical protein
MAVMSYVTDSATGSSLPVSVTSTLFLNNQIVVVPLPDDNIWRAICFNDDKQEIISTKGRKHNGK